MIIVESKLFSNETLLAAVALPATRSWRVVGSVFRFTIPLLFRNTAEPRPVPQLSGVSM